MKGDNTQREKQTKRFIRRNEAQARRQLWGDSN